MSAKLAATVTGSISDGPPLLGKAVTVAVGLAVAVAVGLAVAEGLGMAVAVGLAVAEGLAALTFACCLEYRCCLAKAAGQSSNTITALMVNRNKILFMKHPLS